MQTVTTRSAVVAVVAALLCAACAGAQASCSDRFAKPVFPAIDTTRDIVYGMNTDLTGLLDTLKCDVYRPSGDTSKRRPLVVLIHGGAFITGTRQSDDVILRLCAEFARRGYVTTSIDYRLGVESLFPPQGAYFERANYRAVQDAKAAVRFFRAHAIEYRIDTSLIFEGGTSAGAFAAIHHAYLDQSEVPASVDTVVLGNIEGNSGTPGYSSRISAVVNCWGAIGDTLWMARGNVPIISFHGLSDDVVPYNYGSIFSGLGYDILRVFGSAPIYKRAQDLGIYSRLKLFDSTGHGFPAVDPKMDTTVDMISDFLASIVNCDSGAAAVKFASSASRGAASGWRIRASQASYVFVGDVHPASLRVVDCAGRSAPVRLICNEHTRTITPVGRYASGMYYLFDNLNREPKSVPVFLSAR